MICVYPADSTDFSTNGNGVITPTTCQVTETLNGQYEICIEHEYDEQGKWTRLVEGCIVRAPVPASMTPSARLVETMSRPGTKEVWKTKTDGVKLFSKASTQYSKVLQKLKKGAKVQMVDDTSSQALAQVITSTGKLGWVKKSAIQLYQRHTTSDQATADTVEPAQVRDQPFRIYRVTKNLNKITAYGRHIFYDLANNFIQKYVPGKTTQGKNVVNGIFINCQSDVPFDVYSDLTSTAEDVAFENTNPIEAILGSGGLIENYGGELVRDWYDVYVVERVGVDTQVSVREGKNLTSVDYDVDLSDVVTRIVPTGEDKDGKLLYLDPIYIDSPLIDAYSEPKWYHMAVSEAKEVTTGDNRRTKAQCRQLMRDAAQAEYDKGADKPKLTVTVDFLNCRDVEEFRQYECIQDLFLGDLVTAEVPRLGIKVPLRMTQYTYDCLLNRYSDVTLGTLAETLATVSISAKQLPSGIITGAKIAPGTLTAGNMSDGSVGSLQLKALAVESANLADAAVTTAKIADASITNAKIQDATIDVAKIQDFVAESADVMKAHMQEAVIEQLMLVDKDNGGEIYTVHIASDGTLTVQDTGTSNPSLVGDDLPAGYHKVSDDLTVGSVQAGRIVAQNSVFMDILNSSIATSTLTNAPTFADDMSGVDLGDNASIRAVAQTLEDSIESVAEVLTPQGIMTLVQRSDGYSADQERILQAAVTESASQWSAELSTFKNGVLEKLDYMQFAEITYVDRDGLTVTETALCIGARDASTMLALTHDGLRIVSNGYETSYFIQNEAKNETAKVMKNLTMGGTFQWVCDDTDGLYLV